MTEIRDLSETVYWAAIQDEGRRVKAVGWLGGCNPRTGELSETLRSALRYFAVAHARTDPLLGVHSRTPASPSTQIFERSRERVSTVRDTEPQIV